MSPVEHALTSYSLVDGDRGQFSGAVLPPVPNHPEATKGGLDGGASEFSRDTYVPAKPFEDTNADGSQVVLQVLQLYACSPLNR
jgi:hypothetical protein